MSLKLPNPISPRNSLPVMIPLKLNEQINLPYEVIQAMCNNKYNYVSIKGNKKWKELQLSKIIKYVSQWAINNGLFLCNNQEAEIINLIKNVRFSQLRKLDISGNLIESIQNLCRIEMPCLQKINLKDNKILSLKSFRKINAPNLQYLDLWGNLCNDLTSLSQLKTNKLKQISLQYYDDPVSCNDCCHIAKVQSMEIQVLSLLSEERILQPLFYLTLKNRSLNLPVNKQVVQLFELEAQDNQQN